MAQKRQRAEFGCVQEVRKGRQYRLRYWADTGDGRGYTRRSETVYGTKREAGVRLAELRVRYGTERHRRQHIPTVRELWELYTLPKLDDKLDNGDMARVTYQLKMSAWKRIDPLFGDTLCTEIHPYEVQQAIDSMQARTAGNMKTLMREILSTAVIMELIPANPMDVRYSMPKLEKREKAVYTIQQLMEMDGRLVGSVERLPYILMAFAGCRVGEALGVMAEDVESYTHDGMELAVCHVVRQVSQIGDARDRLKNEQSRRYAIVPAPWSAVVLDAAHDGRRWLADDGCARPLSQLKLRPMLRAHDGMGDLDLRGLRRSWQTFAHWELGIPDAMIEKLMGHIGTGVTAVHYDHPLALQMADVVADAWTRWHESHDD